MVFHHTVNNLSRDLVNPCMHVQSTSFVTTVTQDFLCGTSGHLTSRAIVNLPRNLHKNLQIFWIIAPSRAPLKFKIFR